MKLLRVCVIFSSLMAACGQETDSPEDGDSLQELPVWELQEEVRIDGMEHDLVRINAMAVAENGTIAAAQAQINAVRLFSHEGEPLAMIGGSGDGPGEFQSVYRIGWWSDTLWVYDIVQRRLSLFDQQGALLQTASLPAFAFREGSTGSEGQYPIMAESFAPDGYAIGAVVAPHAQYADDFLEDGGPVPIARIERGGSIEEVIFWRRALDTEEVGGSTSMPPFPNNEFWGVSPDGGQIRSVAADLEGPNAGTLLVAGFTSTGDSLFERRMPFEAIPVPGSVRDSVLEEREMHAREAGSENSAQARRRASRVPDVYPPVTELVVGQDGELWIRGYVKDRGYSVLDRNGRAVARVRVPSNGQVLTADSDHVWVGEFDEFGVESIVRYKLVQ